MRHELESQTYPYPQRAIELGQTMSEIATVSPLELDPSEIASLQEFESELHSRFVSATKERSNTHEIYPKSLESRVGNLLVYAIYFEHKNIKSHIYEVAKAHDISTKSQKQLKPLYNAFFEDILSTFESHSEPVDSSGDSQIFEIKTDRLTKAIADATKSTDISTESLSLTLPNQSLDSDDIIQVFTSLNLANIPFQLRSSLNKYSAGITKNNFVYQSSLGETPDTPQPVCRLVKPRALANRITKLKSLKQELKQDMVQTEGSDSLSEAKKIVIDLYREQVNTTLARSLILYAGTGPDGKEIMSQPARFTSRLDRFVEGASTEYDQHGLRSQISPLLDTLVQDQPDREVRESYPVVDTQDAIDLAQIICDHYGIKPDIKVRKSAKGSFAVSKDSLLIPKNLNLPVDEVLVSLSHEIEGHLLARKRRSKPVFKLKLLETSTKGVRRDVISEISGKWAEDITREQTTGKRSTPSTFIYEALQDRLNHGDFVSAYNTILENLRRQSPNIKEIELRYKAYDRAQRVFRHHTPPTDKSGYITTSNQLKYLEQRELADILKKHDLLGVAQARGVDPYRLSRLLRLGVLKPSDYQQPELMVGSKLWPQILEGLQAGQDIKTIIANIKSKS
jgi:hypothetical protein